ncbi:MAG: endonuclease domain-containing protein [Alphaproteobacteria bacterium]|nr:endonuclease domain-containing protein [Alphaproteobacteria bacterium]
MKRAVRHYAKSLTGFARNLRHDPTPAEIKLWSVLRENSANTGVKFRRQQPIGKYIADFYCAEMKCVIEIDGASHDYKEKEDAVRDVYMQKQGITIFRFSENDVLRDPVAVYQTILSEVKK